MLPYYVSGSADGAIRLWEFGHPKELTAVRPSANMAKINHLEFSSQGNKFAACDADGVVSFWSVASAGNLVEENTHGSEGMYSCKTDGALFSL